MEPFLEQIRRIGDRRVVVRRECAECFSLMAPRPNETGLAIRSADGQKVVLSDGSSVPLFSISLVDPKLTA